MLNVFSVLFSTEHMSKRLVNYHIYTEVVAEMLEYNFLSPLTHSEVTSTGAFYLGLDQQEMFVFYTSNSKTTYTCILLTCIVCLAVQKHNVFRSNVADADCGWVTWLEMRSLL